MYQKNPNRSSPIVIRSKGIRREVCESKQLTLELTVKPIIQTPIMDNN